MVRIHPISGYIPNKIMGSVKSSRYYFWLFAIFGWQFSVLAGDSPFVGSDADAAALTNYLINSKEGKSGKFPLALKGGQVRVFQFISGIHKVRWRGNDSLLFVAIRVESGKSSWKTITYEFTVEPKVPEALNAKEVNWAELLSARRVTQYHIVEMVKNDGKVTKKLLYLSTSTDTE